MTKSNYLKILNSVCDNIINKISYNFVITNKIIGIDEDFKSDNLFSPGAVYDINNDFESNINDITSRIVKFLTKINKTNIIYFYKLPSDIDYKSFFLERNGIYLRLVSGTPCPEFTFLQQNDGKIITIDKTKVKPVFFIDCYCESVE